MTQNISSEAPKNLKEEKATYSFRVTIRDREHFYKIVTWLNTYVGRGESNWTMEGHVLKVLKQGKMANPKIYIFRDDFDTSASIYLSLL
jgi:hypothetical protein